MRSIFGPSGALFQLASLLLLLLSVSWSLLVSRPVVFPLSHRAVAHTSPSPPPPPSFSLFPIVSYLLLDRRWWCISSLGVKSCQVCCSALNLLRTGNKTGKKSFDYDHVIYLDEWKKRFPDIVFMYRHLFSYQIFVTKNTNEVYSSKSCMPKYIQIRVFRLIIPFFAMILKRKEPSKKRSRKRSFFFERNMIIR